MSWRSYPFPPQFRQFLLDIIQKYLKARNLQIGFDKSSVIIFSKDSKNQESKHQFKLGDSPLKLNSETTHVGIKVNSNMKNKSKIESDIQKRLRSFYSLMDITSLQRYSFLSGIWSKMSYAYRWKGGQMFYLLVKVSFDYISFQQDKNRCAFLFYVQKDNFVQCYSVLSDFHPMATAKLCHVTG